MAAGVHPASGAYGLRSRGEHKAPFEFVLFEAVPAFGTVELSAGITGDLPVSGQLILILLMFVGRLGPVTLVSALALRERTRHYQLPEERPVIG